MLCATAASGGHREDFGRRLWTFYRWCAEASVPELTTLAETIETWWPAIEVFLTTGLTNVRTEGTNRLIKQVKRVSVNRLRVQEPVQLPTPNTVALHPANLPIVSEETDGARLRSKSRVSTPAVDRDLPAWRFWSAALGLHLDLHVADATEQTAEASRLVALGATRPVGQLP